MFCPNCGSSLSENSKFCGACGAPIPVAEEPVTTVQEESTQANPEVVEENACDTAVVSPKADTPENSAFVPADTAVYHEEQPEYKAPKKKSPKAIIIVACIVAVGLLCSLFFGKRVINTVKLMVMDPAEYYASIDYKNVETLLDQIDENSADPSDFKLDSELSIEVTKDANDLIKDISGVDLDLDDTKLSLNSLFNIKDDKYLIDLGLGVNKSDDIVSGEIVYDIEESLIYGKVPLLSDEYFSADITELLDSNPSISSNLLSYKTIDDSVRQDLIKYLKKYSKVMFDNCFEFEKSSDKLTVEGVTAKYTLLEAEVSAEDLADVLIAVLEELRDDDEAYEFIEDFLNEYGEMYGISEYDIDNFLDNYEDGIDELIDDLKDTDDNETLFVYKVWVNGNGVIVAREIEVEEVKFGYYNVVSGGKIATEISAKQDNEKLFEFSGVAEISGSTLKNGKYIISIEDMDVVALTLETLDLKNAANGSLNGKLNIKLADDIYDELPAEVASIVEELSIDLAVNSSEKSSAMELSLLSDKDKLLIIALSSKQDNGSKISVPKSSVDVEDYADSINDLDDIISELEDKLSDAGISEDIIDTLSSLADLDGDDDYDYDYDYDYDDYDDEYYYDEDEDDFYISDDDYENIEEILDESYDW